MRTERTWTPEETAWLVQIGHRLPLEDICEALGRSEESVKCKAKRMRLYGRNVGPLRKTGTIACICKSCGRSRYRFSRNGICSICNEHAKIQRCEARMSDALRDLPQSLRSVYMETEAKRESKAPTMPNRQDRRAMEEWELVCLRRQYNAAKKRLQRMREHAGTNPILKQFRKNEYSVNPKEN